MNTLGTVREDDESERSGSESELPLRSGFCEMKIKDDDGNIDENA